LGLPQVILVLLDARRVQPQRLSSIRDSLEELASLFSLFAFFVLLDPGFDEARRDRST